MKDYYKISEISKIYGIGVDSLRYYERLGILKPHRDRNGYRMYSLKDIYKLNMIRDLRGLNFSMNQIKEYLEKQDIKNTLEILHRQQKLIDMQMKELIQNEKRIQDRITSLTKAQKIKTGEFIVKEMKARRCYQLSEHITRDEEMDFVMKKIHRKYEGKIPDFGNQAIGAFLSMKELESGISNVYDAVFFVVDDDFDECNLELPTGMYLSYFYKGNYEQNGKYVSQMFQYAEKNGIKVCGTPFELYEIDNRDTIKEEEFLTEIQVLVEI